MSHTSGTEAPDPILSLKRAVEQVVEQFCTITGGLHECANSDSKYDHGDLSKYSQAPKTGWQRGKGGQNLQDIISELAKNFESSFEELPTNGQLTDRHVEFEQRCKALKNTLKKAKVSNAPQNDWQALINLVGKIRDEVQDAYHLRGVTWVKSCQDDDWTRLRYLMVPVKATSAHRHPAYIKTLMCQIGSKLLQFEAATEHASRPSSTLSVGQYLTATESLNGELRLEDLCSRLEQLRDALGMPMPAATTAESLHLSEESEPSRDEFSEKSTPKNASLLLFPVNGALSADSDKYNPVMIKTQGTGVCCAEGSLVNTGTPSSASLPTFRELCGIRGDNEEEEEMWKKEISRLQASLNSVIASIETANSTANQSRGK